MTLETYPYLTNDSAAEVIRVLRRIIDLRQDDKSILDELLRTTGYTKGFKRVTVSTASAYSVAPEDFYVDVDVTVAGRTMTLNASPEDGETHIITKKDNSANNVTISGNGKNVNGGATITFNTQYQGRLVFYVGAAGEWRALTL